ncbi:MAG: hypothetical protein HY329_14190 [Chloroflexi bacterium]|nr:hypothetical protein [Chloroflexota bacterium]
MQTSVLKDALQAFYTITEPGTIVTLPYEEGDEDAWKEEYEPTVVTA